MIDREPAFGGVPKPPVFGRKEFVANETVPTTIQYEVVSKLLSASISPEQEIKVMEYLNNLASGQPSDDARQEMIALVAAHLPVSIIPGEQKLVDTYQRLVRSGELLETDEYRELKKGVEDMVEKYFFNRDATA